MAEQKKPVLSIGMIVKNEIRSIERCLRALEPLRKAVPCELVIADTGSTDGTREVAAQYADILFDFEWIKDFSAARNAVLDRCSGKWCLMVDADEYLDEDVKLLKAFLLDPKSDRVDFARTIQRNYSSYEMKALDCTDFQVVRLFRMKDTLRYSGIIHESLTFTGKPVFVELPFVVLHHDGYAQKTEPEREAHKQRCARNLELLEKKLADNPKDKSILYVQCIESTCDTAKRKHYCERAFHYLSTRKERSCGPAEKALYARILSILFACKEERAVDLLQSVLPQLQNYFLYLCDVSFHASRYYESLEDYEKALFYALQYQESLGIYDRQAYEEGSFSVSSPSCVYIKERLGQSLHLALYRFKTGSPEKAQEILASVSLAELLSTEHLFVYYWNLLLEMADFVWVQDLAKESFAAIENHEDETKKTWAKNTVGGLLARELAKGQDSPDLSLFEDAPGEWGRSVRLMRATNAAQMQALFEEVEAWEQLPPLVFYHAIELRCPFPQVFYTLGTNSLQNMATLFALQENAAGAFLLWAGETKDDNSVFWVRFAFDCCTLLLQKGGWQADEWNALCRLFVHTAGLFTSHLYHPDFLDSEAQWSVLPTHHHFALLLLLAKSALQEKDELRFVQILQQGLRAAPAMKDLVSHLSDAQNHLAALPPAEMVNLAAQIRAVLAQFPPEDPSLAQLKEGDAYKLVAPLLESKYTV